MQPWNWPHFLEGLGDLLRRLQETPDLRKTCSKFRQKVPERFVETINQLEGRDRKVTITWGRARRQKCGRNEMRLLPCNFKLRDSLYDWWCDLTRPPALRLLHFAVLNLTRNGEAYGGFWDKDSAGSWVNFDHCDLKVGKIELGVDFHQFQGEQPSTRYEFFTFSCFFLTLFLNHI